MKKLYFYITVLCICISYNLNAQSYTVGVPSHEILAEHTYASFGNCAIENTYDVAIQVPLNPLTGIQNILIINQITQQTALYINTSSEAFIGDTLFITPDVNSFKLNSDGPWSISFTIQAIGTPLVANEQYHCGQLAWFDGLSECENFLNFHDFDLPASICFVAPALIPLITESPSDINADLATNNSSVINNPVVYFYVNESHQLLIQNTNENQITAIAIYNSFGEKVTLKSNQFINSSIDVSHLPFGIYYIEATTQSGIVRDRVVLN